MGLTIRDKIKAMVVKGSVKIGLNIPNTMAKTTERIVKLCGHRLGGRTVCITGGIITMVPGIPAARMGIVGAGAP